MAAFFSYKDIVLFVKEFVKACGHKPNFSNIFSGYSLN